MRDMTTVEVPGTDRSVTFDPTAYVGRTVYLHQTGEGYWTGERIGTLGGMVGHGAFALMGEPEGYFAQIENAWAWFTERITPEAAALRMAEMHMNRVAV